MDEVLMNEQELHEAGLEILANWLEGKGFEILVAQREKDALPSMVVKQGEAVTFIIAASAMYPEKGQISDKVKSAVLEHAKQFEAQTACAYIGLANAKAVEAKDKANYGMAYKNARFIADFKGLEYIQFED